MQLLPVGSIADDVYYIYHPHHGLNRVSEVMDQLVDLSSHGDAEPQLHLMQILAVSELGGSQGHGSPMNDDTMGTHIPDPPWVFLRKQGVCDSQAFKTQDSCKIYGKHR